MKYFRSVLMAVVLAFVSFGALAVPVDINKAPASTLAAELNGIGASKAAAIVAYREANGPFRHIEDLSNVKGIGIKTVEKNRSNLLIKSETK